MNVVNWHRYLLAGLGGVLAVALGVQTGVLVVPPELHNAPFYAAVLVAFLNAFIPNVQETTGPKSTGVPPVDGPPPLVPHG